MNARSKDQPYAIVIGLESIVGLQTARILRDRGVPIIAMTDDPGAYCCRTNVCERIITTPPDEQGLIDALEALTPELSHKSVLYPCTDMSVLKISRNRHKLEDAYHVLLPSVNVVEMLMDKVRFYEYAEQQGLPIPRTFFLRSRDDAERAAQELSFPCILKPPTKTPEWLAKAKVGVYKITAADEFLALYDVCHGWADTLMIQEWIEGSDGQLFSCNCYFDADSEPIVTFTARKVRQWPPEAGTSSLGEECRNDYVLEESIRLFRGVDYRGLGYVEFKQDTRTGKHYIIEPNIGRPTGRSAIAEAGGVELLYTMYCDAVGWPLPAGLKQQYGNAKWIYWRRDFQAALFYWRRGDISLREWLQSWRGKKKCAVFSWKDPVPFFADIIRVLGLLLKAKKKSASRPAAAISAGQSTTQGKEPETR
jgi:predicted ATP-grasp superfamily ATP-dependent carboligase